MEAAVPSVTAGDSEVAKLQDKIRRQQEKCVSLILTPQI